MFKSIEVRYKSVFMLSVAVLYGSMMALALLLLLFERVWPCIIAEGLLAASMAVNLTIVPKATRAKAYEASADGFSWRSGVIFPKVTTIPYSRIQQVSIAQNPVSRMFGLYSLQIVNGAQAMASITVPGLTEQTANELKQLITSKLRTEND